MKAVLLALSLLASTPAPTRALVRGVQERLVSRGYPAGYPDGHWSEATTRALREFQNQSGITPTGEADAPTLAALFAPVETPLAIQRVRGEDFPRNEPVFPRQVFGLGAAVGFLLATLLSSVILWRRRPR